MSTTVFLAAHPWFKGLRFSGEKDAAGNYAERLEEN